MTTKGSTTISRDAITETAPSENPLPFFVEPTQNSVVIKDEPGFVVSTRHSLPFNPKDNPDEEDTEMNQKLQEDQSKSK